MYCPCCGGRMLFCPTDGGYVCLECQIGINEVWEVKRMGDWTMRCRHCKKVVTLEEIWNGCPQCGKGDFEVIKTPDGKDIKSKEPPESEG